MSYRVNKSAHPFRRQVGLSFRSRIPTATVAGTPGVIDAVGVSAEVAYGLRRLRSAYSGRCIRVRRSSDNAELDIDLLFNGNLDTATLLAHCGANNGFVVTWYDQSGNGRDVTQATAANQPQIVGAGAVLTRNGKPTVVFDGTDGLTGASATFQTQSVGTVFKATTLSGITSLFRHQPGSGVETSWRFSGTNYQYYRLPTVPTAPGGPGTGLPARIATAIASNGTNSQVFQDGGLVGSMAALNSGTTTGSFFIGWNGSIEQFVGDLSEIIGFTNNLTVAQRKILEVDQALFYAVPTLGDVTWANTYQAANPTTITTQIDDLATANESTFEQVTGGVGALIGITAVMNVTATRSFNSLVARLYVTDTLTYVIDRWNGSAWVADIDLGGALPTLLGGGEWVTLTRTLNAGSTTTKVRLSVQTQGSGIASDVRIGDVRLS